MSRREQRSASALLFLSAYLVALLLCPFYDPNALPSGLRALIALDASAMFIGFLGFVLSFRRPLTTSGDAHAE